MPPGGGGGATGAGGIQILLKDWFAAANFTSPWLGAQSSIHAFSFKIAGDSSRSINNENAEKPIVAYCTGSRTAATIP